MTATKGWCSAQKVCEQLGIEKTTLFRYRDDGTLKLGPHFAAFSNTFSRDSYRWNPSAVKRHLMKLGLLTEDSADQGTLNNASSEKKIVSRHLL